MLRKLVPGLVIVATLSIILGVPLTFAQTVTNTPPNSVGSPPPNGPVQLPSPPNTVVIRPRPQPQPVVSTLPCPVPGQPSAGVGNELGTPNSFPSLINPGHNDFRKGRCNPFNDPHPMLPWGDGQIGGERYGQVIRYWENRAQTVSNVIFVEQVAEESTTPESAPPPTEPQPQSQPQNPAQPSAPQAMLDTKLVRQLKGQDVTVPASWIVETTRGYIHMPRWALQEVGGGRYQWVLVGAWFQPR